MSGPFLSKTESPPVSLPLKSWAAQYIHRHVTANWPIVYATLYKKYQQVHSNKPMSGAGFPSC